MKKKKRKKYVVLLRSTQITAALLLLLLVVNLVHMAIVEKQDGYLQERTIVKESEPLEQEMAGFLEGGSTSAEKAAGVNQPSADGSAGVNQSSVDKSAGAGVNQPSTDESAGAGVNQPSTDESAGAGVNQPAADSSSGGSSLRSGQNAGQSSEPAGDTTLVFAGDIYLSDYVLANYNQSGIAGILSKQMRKELQQADLAIVNNEFPYSTRGTKAPDKQFTFRIDPSYVSVLQEAGVDIVTLANNHVLDYGKEALSDTFQTLDDAGIAYMGAGDSLARAGRLITKKADGRTFGFLAASRVFPVVSWNVENEQPGVFSAYDPAKLIEAVKDAAKHCDFLCVYVHWGIERSETPENYQVTMAHALIDAGADAVIGAHPHVLQGVEYYKGKPVFYSLGNFIFYQSIEKTAVAKLTLSSDGTAKWQLIPARAANASTYVVDDKTACREFYEYMTAISTGVKYTEDGFIIDNTSGSL